MKEDTKCCLVKCDSDWDYVISIYDGDHSFYCEKHVPKDLKHYDLKHFARIWSYVFLISDPKKILALFKENTESRPMYYLPIKMDRADLIPVPKANKGKIKFKYTIPKESFNIFKNGEEGIHYLLEENFTVYCGRRNVYVGDCVWYCNKNKKCNRWKKVHERQQEKIVEANTKRLELKNKEVPCES